MKRLFVALRIPEPLRGALADLRMDRPGVRWTAPRALHLTLHFIGDTPAERVPRLAEVVAGITAPPVPLAVEALDTFGRPPHVFVAEVEAVPALRRLHGLVGEALAAEGIAPDARPFRPHVTLARLRKPSHDDVDALRDRPAPEVRAQAEELVLFESVLSPRGALYRAVQSVRLGG